MANSNGWGDGAANNAIGWGQGANNAIGWGDIHADSWAGLTDIVGITTDPDAQAFITAASITDPTQQAAINQLVVDLKGYNIWTKMKALYPFVGGTASAHKWNLKDPRDLDAAFRLVFSGGWTHSSTGATPNGTNGYADTKLLPQTQISQNSAHISAYSRTNSVNSNDCLLGTYGGGTSSAIRIVFEGGTTYRTETNNLFSGADFSNSVHNGFFVNSRISSSSYKTFRSGTTLTTKSISSLIPSHKNIFLSANNGEFGISQYSLRQLAFASIGDGLTDTEAANFYTAVQTFQVSLGRSIGTQTVSDADAQAFVTNAGIVDQVEANAVNNLVIGLKADSLWSKMKALYPMVGGSSSTMKYNLKNPLDTDAAFRLVFNGGWTFSSNGATPNGTNAFADTKLNDNSVMTLNNAHVSYYSRTQSNGTEIEIGAELGANILEIRTSGVTYARSHGSLLSQFNDSDSRAFYIGNRTASNLLNTWRNGIKQNTNTTNQSSAKVNVNYFLGAVNTSGVGTLFSTKQCAFASIGDGLSDAEATNLYNRVQTFNTALARQV